MAIFKIEAGERYTLEGVLWYIYDDNIHDNKIIYKNAIGASINNPALDMILCQKLYDKMTGVRYKQMELCLSEYETNNVNFSMFVNIVDDIANLIFNKTQCQIVYAIHANTDNLHAHFVVNMVRYIDGKKLKIDYTFTKKLKIGISDIMNIYGLNKIL